MQLFCNIYLNLVCKGDLFQWTWWKININCVIKKGIFSEFTSEHFGSRGWLHHSTTMSYTYRDYNSDVADQSVVKSSVPGVLGSIQL